MPLNGMIRYEIGFHLGLICGDWGLVLSSSIEEAEDEEQTFLS